MGFIPSFIISSTAYSITLTPGVLNQDIALAPTVKQGYSAAQLYTITTDSPGDGVGTSDMGAEGYIDLNTPVGGRWTIATAHRSIDNQGVNTTYYFYVVEYLAVFFRQPFGAASGPKPFLIWSGKFEPASTGVLPNAYQAGWQGYLMDAK